jgi:hypothetical protein
MTDAETRGLVLQHFYNVRHNPNPWLRSSILMPQVSVEPCIIMNVCKQLADDGLIDWKPSSRGSMEEGLGTITSRGVKVVEGRVEAGIAIVIHDHSVSISGSENVIVGNSNQQNVKVEIGKLASVIDRMDAGDEDKKQAKSLIEKITSNPLVVAALTTILGATTGNL